MTDLTCGACTGFVVLALVAAGPAWGEIHDYQILRLLYLATPCGVTVLTKLDSAPEIRRFRAECSNVSAYPKGVTVVCTDVNDDRSCRIETPAREFDSLRLLQRAPGPSN